MATKEKLLLIGLKILSDLGIVILKVFLKKRDLI